MGLDARIITVTDALIWAEKERHELLDLCKWQTVVSQA